MRELVRAPKAFGCYAEWRRGGEYEFDLAFLFSVGYVLAREE
jgi:hypothetical protein